MARNESEQRTVALNFITNATQTKAEVDGLMNSLDSTSDEFQELQQQSASLESAISDLNNVMSNSTGSSNILNTSMSKLEGEMNRADASIKRLNNTSKQSISTTDKQASSTKTLTKEVTENGGAMAILDTITGGWASTARDAIEATALFTTGTNLSTIAQRAYTFVVGTSTGALKAFRIALAATGIGAAVVLIGFLVEAFMSLSSATDEAAESQRRLNAEMANNQYEETISRLEFLAEIRKEQAREQGQSISQIRDLERQANEERLNELDKQRRDGRLTSEQVQKAGESYLQQQRKIVLQEARWRADDAESVRTTAKENAKVRVAASADANKKIIEDAKKAQEEAIKILNSGNYGSQVSPLSSRISDINKLLSSIRDPLLFEKMFNQIDPNKMINQIVDTVSGINEVLNNAMEAIEEAEVKNDSKRRNRLALTVRVFQEFRAELIGVYRDIKNITEDAGWNDTVENAFSYFLNGVKTINEDNILKLRDFIITNKADIEREFGSTSDFIKRMSADVGKYVSLELGQRIEDIDIVSVINDIQKALESGEKSVNDYVKNAEKLATFMEKFKQEAEFKTINDGKGLTILNTLFGDESDMKNYIDNMVQYNDMVLQMQEEAALWEIEQLNGSEEQKQAIRDYYENLRIEKAKEASDALEEIDRLRLDQQLTALNAFGSLLGATSGLMEEHTTGHKVLAIAQTTIDTYTSAMSAYAGMVQAIPGPVGIAAGVAAAAASVVTGISNVKKILAVKVPGGGSTGGGGVPSSASATPNVSFVSSSENQIANSVAGAINNSNQEPIKAYVVTSEVESGLALERNAVDNNSL